MQQPVVNTDRNWSDLFQPLLKFCEDSQGKEWQHFCLLGGALMALINNIVFILKQEITTSTGYYTLRVKQGEKGGKFMNKRFGGGAQKYVLMICMLIQTYLRSILSLFSMMYSCYIYIKKKI